MKRLAFALTALLAGFAHHAEAQTTRQNCEAYARTTLDLKMRAEEGACGVSGPLWRGDYAAHLDWCLRAGGPAAAAGLTEQRRRALAACRGEASIPRLEIAPRALETLRIARRGPSPEALAARIGARLDATPARRAALHIYRPPDLAPLIGLAQPPRLSEDALTQRFGALALQPPDASGVYVPPRIASVLTVPSGGRIQPGGALLITGAHFGAEPGQALLRYESRRETAGGEFRPEETVVRTAPLAPYRADWAQSWLPRAIMARVSHDFADIDLAAERPAELLVVRKDGAVARAAVVIGVDSPRIARVETARGDGHIRPGERVIVTGAHFGTQPGAVALRAHPPAKRSWKKFKGMKQYVFWPEPGDQGVAGSGTPVPIGAPSWSDGRIDFTTAPLASGAFHHNGFATITVRDARGRIGVSPYQSLWFGPDQTSKAVSGLEWLDESARESITLTDDGGAMIVTHTPDCGVFGDSNEKGVDWFFAEKDWPQDVQIVGFTFTEIDPDDPYGAADFFADQAGDLLNALSDGPLGVAAYIGERALDAILGGGTGGYHAYVSTAPGGYSWRTRGVRAIGVKWESDCALSGDPIRYAVSFAIVGTPAALAKH